MSHQLPQQFQDLQRFTKWIHPTMEGRLKIRLESTYEEIKEFYEAFLARAPDVLAYLDEFEIVNLPEAENNLRDLSFSFLNAVSCVEYYHDTRIPMGVEHERMVLCRPSDFF